MKYGVWGLVWWVLTSQDISYSVSEQLVRSGNCGEAIVLLERVPLHERGEQWYYLRALSSLCDPHENAIQNMEKYLIMYPEGPHSSQIRLNLARIYLRMRRWENALSQLEKVIETDKSIVDRNVLYDYGIALMMSGNYKKASEVFFSLMGGEGCSQTDISVAYYYAVCKFNLGEYEVSAHYFKELMNQNPKFKDIPLYLLYCYYNMGEYEKVVEAGIKYGIAYNKGGNYATISRLIGESLFRTGKYNECIPFLEYAVRNTSVEIVDSSVVFNIRLMLGIAYLYIDDLESASKVLTSLYVEYPQYQGDVAYYLGYIAHKRGDFNKAQIYYEYAGRESRHAIIREDARWQYTIIAYRTAGDPFNKAVSILVDYIENPPPYPQIVNEIRQYDISEMLYSLAVKSGNYPYTYHILQRVRGKSKHVDYAMGHVSYNAALYHYNNGDYDSAAVFAGNSLRFSYEPDLIIRNNYIRGLSYIAMKEYESALISFKSAMNVPTASQHELYPYVLFNIAVLHYIRGEDTTSLAMAKSLLENTNIKNKELYYSAVRMAGDIYRKNKMFRNAVPYYYTAASIKPDNKNLSLLLESIEMSWENDTSKNVLYQMLQSENKVIRGSAHSLLAKYHFKNNQYDSAIPHFQRYITLQDGNVKSDIIIGYALSLFNTGNTDSAISLLANAITSGKYQGTDKEIFISYLRSFYLKNDRYNEFADFVKRNNLNVHVPPEDSILYERLVSAISRGECQSIIASAQRFIKKSQTLRGENMAMAMWHRASCYMQGGDTASAVADILAIVDMARNKGEIPTNSQYLIEAIKTIFPMWVSKEQTDRVEEMAPYIIDTLMCDTSLKKYALVHYSRIKYKKQDMGALASLISRHTNLIDDMDHKIAGELYFYCGTAYFNLQNYDSAEMFFGRVCPIVKNYFCGGAKYYLASITYLRGDTQNAISQIYSLINEGPSYARWNGKSLILLARILYQSGKEMEAHSLLKSIINGDFPDFIIREAKEEMKKLNLEEYSGKKQDTETRQGNASDNISISSSQAK